MGIALALAMFGALLSAPISGTRFVQAIRRRHTGGTSRANEPFSYWTHVIALGVVTFASLSLLFIFLENIQRFRGL